MIDEGRLTNALDAVAAHLTRLGRPAASLLQPGLSRNEVSQLEAALPFRVTEELRVLYQWRNGTDVTKGFMLGELWFFPGFYLPSLENAVRMFSERRKGVQWRKSWFPFLADDGGNFYVAPCQRKPVDQALVIAFEHGEPEQEVEFLNITAMMETFVDCYAQGAFFVADDGSFEMDDDAYERIARYHNPGVAVWQS
jgi:hypothetical protein